VLLGSKSLLYFDNSKTLPSDSQPQFDYMNLLIQIYAKFNTPFSFFPHAPTRFFLLLHLACSMTAKRATVVTPC